MPKGLCAHSCWSRPLSRATWHSRASAIRQTLGTFSQVSLQGWEACAWSRWTTAIALMLGKPAELWRKESWAVGWRWAQACERCSGTASPAPGTVGSGTYNPFGEPKRLQPALSQLLVPAESGGSSSASRHPGPGILQPKGITVWFVVFCASVNDILLFRQLLLLLATSPPGLCSYKTV